jgi:hypothetical protein
VKQVYGIFYADTRQVAGTYVAEEINLDAFESDRPVIHADVPSWVSPTNCKLIQIAGIWHAVTNVEYAIADAASFGQRIIIKFAAENVLLGIIQLGMASTVRGVMSAVIQCLQTGSLYDAVDQLRAIPPESKDGTFVTDARLLVFVNLIKDYLGLARLASL